MVDEVLNGFERGHVSLFAVQEDVSIALRARKSENNMNMNDKQN